MSRNKRNSNRRKRRRTFLRTFLLFIFLFTLIGLGATYVYNILNKVDTVIIPIEDTDLGIKDDVFESSDVINIALFGIDEEETENNGRADSIMIASLDKAHNKIKLTSIMRDTYVDIPGYKKDKINHSHVFGGPQLSIRTINQNFDMNIRDFVTIDLFGFEEIIDTLDGLEVNVKENEVPFVNMGVREANRIDGGKGLEITDSGLQTLDGRQSVSYSRIRKTGDGDFERTERQRFVMEQIIHKGLNAGITKYPALLNTALPLVKTSLSKTEMLSLGKFVFESKIQTIEKYRIPTDNHFLEEKIDGIFYLIPDTLSDNAEALRAFIYDDMKNEYVDEEN